MQLNNNKVKSTSIKKNKTVKLMVSISNQPLSPKMIKANKRKVLSSLVLMASQPLITKIKKINLLQELSLNLELQKNLTLLTQVQRKI